MKGKGALGNRLPAARSWGAAMLTAARKPEPEVMDEAGEVEAYASAAAQAHLDDLDNAFVREIISLGITAGIALDVGTGPGSIPVKVARKCPGLRFVGADLSPSMLDAARHGADSQGINSRVAFVLAGASRLCFASGTFDLVISNSLLHHLSDPVAAFDEMARVTKRGGKVFLRDLRRPPRFAFSIHAFWYGRHYSGRMRQLYRDSLRAAYTPGEISGLLRGSRMSGAKVASRQRTYVTVQWDN